MIACHHYLKIVPAGTPDLSSNAAKICANFEHNFYFIFEGLVCAGRHDFEVMMIACHHYLKFVPACQAH